MIYQNMFPNSSVSHIKIYQFIGISMHFDHSLPVHNDCPDSQRNNKGQFFEDANNIVASVPQRHLQNGNIPMDYNWTPQMGNKVISLGPATCNIALSPARPRSANPGLRCSFYLY
jgi:hypothetical protein